jgi:hypothetical protein
MDYVLGCEVSRLCLAATDALRRLGNTEVVAKDGVQILFSNAFGSRPRTLITKELTVVTAIYSHFEELLHTTPYICRNKEYVSKQVAKLIPEAMSRRARRAAAV